MKKFWLKYKVIVLYCIFGILTTLIDWFIFYFLKEAGLTKTNAGFTACNAVSFTVSMIFSYVTNKRIVYKSTETRPYYIFLETLKFAAGRVFSGAIEVFLPAPLSHYLEGITLRLGDWGLYLDRQWIAKIVVSSLVVFINYFFGKWFVFKDKKETDKEANKETDKETE